MSVLIVALVSGAAVGLAIGALGGGGGVLAVPALVYLLHLAPADASTTSLIVVTATSLTAVLRHARAGTVRWRVGVAFAAAGVLPAIAASVLAGYLPKAALTTAFAVVTLLAAVAMLRNGGPGEGAENGERDRGANETSTRGAQGIGKVMGAGAGLGTVTGLLGVGGGFLAVPTLVTVLSLRMRLAVGTSLVVIAVNSVAALAARLAVGPTTLDPATFGPFAGAAILGAWDGRRLAARWSGRTLQRMFAALLIALAAFMLVDALR